MQRSISLLKRFGQISPIQKRWFAWVSEPRFDDEYGWMISISAKKAINVAEYRDQPSVNIREFSKLDDGTVVPTKKGIFLSKENYKAIMECEGSVKQIIEKVKKGETS